MKRSDPAVTLYGLLAIATMLMIACSKHRGAEKTAGAAPARASEANRITAGPALRQQLRIGRPEWTQVSNTMRVAGRVETDETRIAQVNSPVVGRITELKAVEGQQVKRGQVLATVSSTELTAVQLGFLKAVSQRQLNERTVSRAKLLLDAGVISEAELQRREAELQQANAELSSARDQLHILGMPAEALDKLESTRSLNSFTQILAPIDGMVLERKVTIGQIVQPAAAAFTIADLSHVWLIADVPAQSASDLTVGKAIEAELSALPGQTIRGHLSYVSATVDPQTRTVRTRMDLPNSRGRYKPAMLAMMLLKDPPRRLQVIPATAPVREGNQEYVFVQVTPEAFVLRPVTLGAEVPEGRVLLGGVQEGESIVLDGAFHLNNERKRMALQGDS